ncbi:MAG: hypothetical protein L6Q76_32110 [Polyangiaceae bacterium]|nr:hypothetical protein [Polyangiaceae bacterium]
MAQGIQTTPVPVHDAAPLIRPSDPPECAGGSTLVADEIITRTATIRLDARGFVHVIITPMAEQRLADALENIEAVRTLGRGSSLPMLVDMRRVKSIDNAAQEQYRSGHSPPPRVRALLVASPLSRIIANYFVTMFEGPIPTRVFTSELDAMSWISQHIS